MFFCTTPGNDRYIIGLEFLAVGSRPASFRSNMVFLVSSPHFLSTTFSAQFFVGLIGLVSLVIVIGLVSIVGLVGLVDLVCLVNCSLKRQCSNQISKQRHLIITKVPLPAPLNYFDNFINYVKHNFLF